MEWFKKYGEIPIIAMLLLLYILLYCSISSISFVIIKCALAIIGASTIGCMINKMSFWLRDKIVEIVENGGID